VNRYKPRGTQKSHTRKNRIYQRKEFDEMLSIGTADTTARFLISEARSVTATVSHRWFGFVSLSVKVCQSCVEKRNSLRWNMLNSLIVVVMVEFQNIHASWRGMILRRIRFESTPCGR
jgi:hypothetical protein